MGTNQERQFKNVRLYGYSKLAITWPIAVVGPALWAVDWMGLGNPVWLTWIFIGTMGFVGLAGFVDVKRDHAWAWGATIGCLVASGFVLYLWQGINLFDPVRSFFGEIETVYSRTLVLKISGLWLGVLGLVRLHAWLNNCWIVTPNDIRRNRLWSSAIVHPHSQIRASEEYYDILEGLLLFGGGRIRLKRPNGQLIADITHVPFLNRKWSKIANRLHVISVATLDDQVDEEVTAEVA